MFIKLYQDLLVTFSKKVTQNMLKQQISTSQKQKA